MSTYIKPALLVPILSMFFTYSCTAYDFRAKTSDGVTIYYKVLSYENQTVAVTYKNKRNSGYYGMVEIPSCVQYRGKSFQVTEIGEFAFCVSNWLDAIEETHGVYPDKRMLTAKSASLKYVKIPDTVTAIRKYAFAKAINLSRIHLPNSLTYIGKCAFDGCGSLRQVSIPTGVTHIDDAAFRGCGFDSLTIPDSVSYIGDYVLNDCHYLSELTIGTGVKEFSSYELDGCERLSAEKILGIITTLHGLCNFLPDSISCFCVPENITRINSFGYSKHIDTLLLHKGVEHFAIGNHSRSLRSIVVNSENKYYSSIDGVLFNKEQTNLLFYPYCREGNDYAIPNGVKEVAELAFYGCHHLFSVTIPEGIQKIGTRSFARCDNLRSITIPASVTDIGVDAFADCKNLKEIIFRGNQPPQCEYYTYGNKYIYNSEIKIVVPAAALEAYRQAPVWKDCNMIEVVENQ